MIFENLDNFDGQQQILYLSSTSESDEVSEPTVLEVQDEHVSLSDDGMSTTSERSFLAAYTSHMSSANYDDNSIGLSSHSSSRDDKAQSTTVAILKNKLHTQEATKLELLRQCLGLEKKLEDYEKRLASLQECRAQNHQLRETNTKMEHEFMNAMNEIVLKMAQEEETYSETLQKHELKIKDLERELRLLKLKKRSSNDDDSTITVETIELNVSGSSLEDA
jgi:chromosome segregation ATPase